MANRCHPRELSHASSGQTARRGIQLRRQAPPEGLGSPHGVGVRVLDVVINGFAHRQTRRALALRLPDGADVEP